MIKETVEERRKRELRNRKAYMKRHPDRLRATAVKQHYGISWDEYMHLYDTQKGACALCKTSVSSHNTPEKKYPVAHVDHCHKTNKVRGLLCGNCNKGIGLLQDSPTICRIAAEYLEKGEELDEQ